MFIEFEMVNLQQQQQQHLYLKVHDGRGRACVRPLYLTYDLCVYAQ